VVLAASLTTGADHGVMEAENLRREHAATESGMASMGPRRDRGGEFYRGAVF
jgi:hypothetical protein